jgi:hypothetical protein
MLDKACLCDGKQGKIIVPARCVEPTSGYKLSEMPKLSWLRKRRVEW